MTIDADKRKGIKYRVCMSSLLAILCLTGCGKSGGTGTQSEDFRESETMEESVILPREDPRALRTAAGLPDFTALRQLNPDIYAWLEIPDTDISFPVLQSADDIGKYLTHNVYGEEDENGSIYTEYCNSRDFSDPNTVIYGRNTEKMFGGLHRFRDRDFFEEHREIIIYLEGKTLTWRIFAVYPYDDRHLIGTYDFSDKTVFMGYLEDIFAIRAMDAYLDDSMTVTAQDKILTLSTGVTGEPEQRYLVQAVLEGGGQD